MEIEKINNEFGETLTKDELNMAVNIVMSLSMKEIDELWFKIGWIDSEKDSGYKALPEWRLDKIKRDRKSAEGALFNLFQETPKKEFISKILGEKAK